MDHYLDIRLLPDPEFPPSMLMNALFAKLHRGLVDLDSTAIGVSFPDHTLEPLTLGQRLRLHGELRALTDLMGRDWLRGMRDHIELHGPIEIPGGAPHRAVRRVQAKSSPERLRRRLIKRKGIDQVAASAAIPDHVAERLDLPFVTLQSRSSGQTFRLFIEHGPAKPEPTPGSFSHYGLGRGATVPWF
jgi:CRISPR-associated endonuclease Csy4